MNKLFLTAAAATIVFTPPASAQSAQDRLDAQYDRALAAGYKALMLCSATANAEFNGTTRTPESIHEWELTGIQAPLDDIVRDLPYEMVRESGTIDYVAVNYDEGAYRYALYVPGLGCAVQPTGFDIESFELGYGEAEPQVRTPLPEDKAAFPDLEGLLVSAIDNDIYGEAARTTGIVIARSGTIVAEDYAIGFDASTPQRTWSVAKSIAATVVGAAVQRGETDVSATAGLGVDDTDPRRAITIDHALRMASGRYSDTPGNRTDPLYWGGTTVDERAQNWPLLNAPGTVYRYANNDTLAAVMAIEETLVDHPPAALFRKLGMTHTVAETDWQGNYVLSSQVWSTARDLARLGQLYLQDGVWDGERILPENWREYVSTASGPQPDGPFGYGAGWWLFNTTEGVPSDTFAAMGNRGQYVVVLPSRDVVIVRRGEDMVGTRFDIAAFARDVLAALDD